MITTPATTTLYLAGPMSGYEDYNRPAFYQAAAKLRAHGFTILNPAETRLADDADWTGYMREAIRQVTRADAVAHLPDWQDSRGARLEHRIARDLRLPWLPVRYWHSWAAGRPYLNEGANQ